MRKIFFTLHTGFCGSDGHEVHEFNDDVTDDELNQFAWELALSNAEAYGIYPNEDMPEDYDENEDEGWNGDQYSDNIEGSWEDYDAEKHEGMVL